MPRKVNANKDQVPSVPKYPQVPQANQMTKQEFMASTIMLAQVLASLKTPTMAFKVRNFTRKNPPKFDYSKVGKDLHEFINKVYKVVKIMGVSSEEKQRYQLTNSKEFLKFGSHNGSL